MVHCRDKHNEVIIGGEKILNFYKEYFEKLSNDEKQLRGEEALKKAEMKEILKGLKINRSPGNNQMVKYKGDKLEEQLQLISSVSENIIYSGD